MKRLILSFLAVFSVASAGAVEVRDLTADEAKILNGIAMPESVGDETVLDYLTRGGSESVLAKLGYRVDVIATIEHLKGVDAVFGDEYWKLEKEIKSGTFGDGKVTLWKVLRRLSAASQLKLRVRKDDDRILVFESANEARVQIEKK